MLSILKTNYAKVMSLFYKNKFSKFHLREIARQTNLFEPSVYNVLGNLESDNILQFEKLANLKNYFIKKTSTTYLIFELFDLDKFESLPSIRKKAIKLYLDALPKKPVFAILFGSTAKGTFTSDSDIDILLISNDKLLTKKAENEVDALTAMNISSFQITYDSFLSELKLKEDKVVHSALNSGFPLINHIEYYEVLFDERI